MCVIKIGLKSYFNISLNYFKYVSSFVFNIISESIEAPRGGHGGSDKYKTDLHVLFCIKHYSNLVIWLYTFLMKLRLKIKILVMTLHDSREV